MNKRTVVLHSPFVDTDRADVLFVGTPIHRAYLRLPLHGNRGDQTLCVIGQNPSAANRKAADKTIRYIEDLIIQRYPTYKELVFLNLYSQVDTKKEKKSLPLCTECAQHFERIVQAEQDFLVVFGKLKNHHQYLFRQRASDIKSLFDGKRVFKLDVGTPYAPHPGNSKILYSNFDVLLKQIKFADVL